jgi:hypothetical protein
MTVYQSGILAVEASKLTFFTDEPFSLAKYIDREMAVKMENGCLS